jgi:hypothetical protein
MKKLLSIAFLAIGMMVNAQGFGTKEYFTASISVDPNATIKESSPNLVAELELVNYWMYVKASIQVLPDLEGGYFDYGGGLGLNLYLDRFETIRTYAGGRLGVIKRGGESYPLAGYEAGIDFNLTETMFIGLRGTGDYREDFQYWGGEAETRYSGFIRVGFKF